MKRPRIALCLLMALFATSLYAVGFAADRDNAGGRYDASDWGAHEADLCEYANDGYCEFAYDRSLSDYSYDGCTGGDDDSVAAPDDENCQVSPVNLDDELEAAAMDDLEAVVMDEEAFDLAADDYAATDAPSRGYENDYDYTYDYDTDDYTYDNAYSSQNLAGSAEPLASDDDNTWCGCYCLSRDSELQASAALPDGAIRTLVQRVSDALVQLLSDPNHRLALADAGQIAAEDDNLVEGEDSQDVMPLVAAAGWLDGQGWSAANEAMAAGMNRAVMVDPLALSAQNLRLPASQLQPVSLRALARPLARLAVELRSSWQQAWSEVNELAAEADEVPEVSIRPEAPAASPPGDAGRDTRTSLRRNPRRVEI